ncbi:unnamed protein product [Malus baccata var. baccata]|uniref:Uncharacterized protein n=1 Tax=Malus domestica TaxID=3750 RepID=A0A498JCC2_MALDO|nr:hypothetical protein DVH24_013964 [Malus domestica]
MKKGRTMKKGRAMKKGNDLTFIQSLSDERLLEILTKQKWCATSSTNLPSMTASSNTLALVDLKGSTR